MPGILISVVSCLICLIIIVNLKTRCEFLFVVKYALYLFIDMYVYIYIKFKNLNIF